MYEFSSKSQRVLWGIAGRWRCLRYCKCTSFQANHNLNTPRVRKCWLFAILQMYEFSSKSQRLPSKGKEVKSCLRYCKCTSFQANHNQREEQAFGVHVVCDTANVRVFKQITTDTEREARANGLFAILQMYEFSSKSQHNSCPAASLLVVCDTANVRVFKQITTIAPNEILRPRLFAILQMYEFSSKSQP